MSKDKNKDKKLFQQAVNVASFLSDRARIQKDILTKGIGGIYEDFEKRQGRSFQILRYQRVCSPSDLPYPITEDAFILPETLKMHCKFVKENCTVLSMSELIYMLSNETKIPSRSVVITFDGGFLDTYLKATPILLEYNIPASFFVYTDYLHRNTLLPEDRLLYACAYMQHKNIKIPLTEALAELLDIEYREEIKEIQVDENIAQLLVTTLRNIETKEQNKLLEGFNLLLLKDLEIPPPPPHFMTWKDISHLLSLGFETGTLGHYPQNIMHDKAEEITSSIRRSLDEFRENSISPLPCYTAPYGILNNEVESAFRSSKLEALIGIECDFIKFQDTDHPLYLLPRRRMLEATSFSKDLFAASLWEYQA